jgi:hypothetical protein
MFSIALLISGSVFSQEKLSAESTKALKFLEVVYDFGKIPQGKPVHHLFQATNMSSKSVAIENVQASCGCTTPEWSRDPIAVGANSPIKVGYNAAAIGYFEKTINVQYGQGLSEIITIKGTVWKTPEQPAPENKGIAGLKALKN